MGDSSSSAASRACSAILSNRSAWRWLPTTAAPAGSWVDSQASRASRSAPRPISVVLLTKKSAVTLSWWTSAWVAMVQVGAGSGVSSEDCPGRYKRRRRSASVASCVPSAMPAASMAPAPERSPAVSTKVTATPPQSTVRSTASRVVPGSALTRARRLPTRWLNKLDLPALTGPTRATVAPSIRRSTLDQVPASRSQSAPMLFKTSANSASSSSPSSSPGWSRRASSSAPASRSRSRRPRRVSSRTPSTPALAARTPAIVRARMSPSMASAWTRSRRPCTTARRVNSPGLAGRAPRTTQRASTASTSAGLPWQDSSTTSSPV